MSKTTPIYLNHDAVQAEGLRPNQLLSFSGEGIHIHLAKSHPYYFRQLQKAGRAVDQLGVLAPALTGQWTFEDQWAFQLGYSRYKNPGHITPAPLPATEAQKFEVLSYIWNWVRTQINTGPSQCPPEVLAESAAALIKEFAADHYSLKIEKIAGEALKQKGFVGCYAVGRASEFPPVLLSIKIYPKGQENQKIKAAVIGKGITFDSGGYVLKPRDGGIGYMKCDMGGAATVTGAVAFSLFEGLHHPIELILCCAENLISGEAYRPGDVLTYKNGLKVEIVNTDAEGRVVLADGFLKAQEEKPELIIDAATLTGAAKVAVGSEYAALFSMDKNLSQQALNCAEACHEGLWPLPLETWHQEAYPSLVADTLNADTGPSAGPAGASSAAGFLSRFVDLPKQKWLHFDLASVYAVSGNGMWPGGATGQMIRTIAALLHKSQNNQL